MNEKEEMKICEESSLIYNHIYNTNYDTRFSREDNEQWFKKRQTFDLIEWQCSFCTYINPPNVNECQVCSTKRSNTNLGQTSSFSVFNLQVGDLVDCADFRGEIYPSKVVSKEYNKITIHFRGWIDLFNEELDLLNDKHASRIRPYESCKSKYGIGKYTLKDENMEKHVIKIKNLEDPNLALIYIPNREVYLTIDNTIYVYKILEFDKTDKTLVLQKGSEILKNIPIYSVELDISKIEKIDCCRYEIIKDNTTVHDENNSNNITINSERKILKESNSIDIITNSVISDLNKVSIYRNENEKIEVKSYVAF